jgi:transcriptional regulator with XRE-family HTH domain
MFNYNCGNSGSIPVIGTFRADEPVTLGIMETSTAATLGEIVGRNLRRARNERKLTQEELTRRLREHGFMWTRPMVHTLETGRRALGMEELAMLLLAFDDLSPRELLMGDGDVLLAAQVNVPLRPLQRSRTPEQLWTRVFEALVRHSNTYQAAGPPAKAAFTASPAEQRIADRLGLEPRTVAETALRLWGRPFAEEREWRVRENLASGAAGRSMRALRGHVTRELSVELEPEL